MSKSCEFVEKNHLLSNGRYLLNKKAFRRKSPIISKKTFEENSVKKDVLISNPSIVSPLSAIRLKITPSDSIDVVSVDSSDDFNTDHNQNFLTPDDGFEDDHFEDARSEIDSEDLAKLNINYDLPSDPIARNSWIRKIRNLNGARSKSLFFYNLQTLKGCII